MSKEVLGTCDVRKSDVNNTLNLSWDDFSGEEYCQAKCEFYNTCHGDREICPKNVFVSKLNTLTEMEQAVVKLTFGFCDNKRLNLTEVADYLNITTENVRQITSKALRKMRHPARSHAILKRKSDYISATVDFYKNVIDMAYKDMDIDV